MKLQKFPLDNQTCIINIGSCKYNVTESKESLIRVKRSIFSIDGYTTKDLKFIWNRGSDLERKEPVTISPKLEMPDFSLKEYIVINCDRATSTGKFYD